MAKKQRLDLLVVERGLAESRTQAQALVMAGEVRVNGEVARKAGQQVDADAQIEVARPLPYVSRGGVKLEGALADFGYDPAGKLCADVGASTGGFTDVLLQQGAVRVYAIDVGYGQLAWKLRQDERVVVIERTNARHLDTLGESIDLTVMDASFISIELLLPAIAKWLRPAGDVITLIKPQFEAGREEVGKGGVVRDAAVHERVLTDLVAHVESHGWTVRALTVSPIAGPAGNIEFFLWLGLGVGEPYDMTEAVKRVLERAQQIRGESPS
ncbi:MAG: TlyA family RNA methyltransferase [Ardenticatenales bacterium]|nr:TlyA family RNA methyltransferase [Ardenticatenales bacterium]